MTAPSPSESGGARPHLGVVLPQGAIRPPAPAAVRTFAEALERDGFDHLLVYDHVLGADSTSRPGWSGYYDHTSSFLEPMVLFAYLGASTKLEMISGILVLPQRQTALVAKQAATVDVLLEGRLRLGVGIGWNDVEYDALGVGFGTRARRFEEQIGLLRRLWTEPVVSHAGDFDHIDRAGIEPLPLQRPIPVWIGCGDSRAALERVGRLADGWIPDPTLGAGDRLAEAWSFVQQAAEAAGRDPRSLGLQAQVRLRNTGMDEMVDRLEHWMSLGATHVAFNTLEAGLAWPQGHVEACASVGELWSSALGADR